MFEQEGENSSVQDHEGVIAAEWTTSCGQHVMWYDAEFKEVYGIVCAVKGQDPIDVVKVVTYTGKTLVIPKWELAPYTVEEDNKGYNIKPKQSGRYCMMCYTNRTCQWRRYPKTAELQLCNACWAHMTVNKRKPKKRNYKRSKN